MIDWFDQTEFERIAHYIEMNPVKSGAGGRRRSLHGAAPGRLTIGRRLPTCPTRAGHSAQTNVRRFHASLTRRKG
jgi:hypothetical protein